MNRVLMVCTRDIPPDASNGRERTMAFIQASLRAHGQVQMFRIESALERRSIRRLLAVLGAFVAGLVRLQPVPLQSLLFHDPRYRRQLLAAVDEGRPTAVYFDGVRSGRYACWLKRRRPGLRMVCDFDDLMSRRMAVLAQARQPVSMGYLKSWVPAWVQRHVLDGTVARWIQAYERRALRLAEREIAVCCESVVLVSAVDADHLRADLPLAPVEVIPPMMAVQRPFATPFRIDRFVFIGSDNLLQNRQSIEYLVALWQRLRPAVPLHFFGKQSGSYPSVPGITFRGFVPEVAAAYEPGSVLLAPAFLSGGVKTKILEAMAHGIVPVGNSITFEGIDAPTKPLCFDGPAMEALVRSPEHFADELAEAGQRAIEVARRTHSVELLSVRWASTIWPSAFNSSLAGLSHVGPKQALTSAIFKIENI